jgi:dipeptidase E
MRRRRLLLISNSTAHGAGYLDHCAEALSEFLAGVSRVLFVPFALRDHDGYAAKARERFGRLGLGLESLHQAADAVAAVNAAEAVFVGGGNTFRLLAALCGSGALAALRERAVGGMPYVGASAGVNVACPTIRTTNDMPIVEPPSFAALDLVPFQINPHYLDPDPGSTHQGETREERLREYLEENDRPVVGLREGSMLWVADGRVTLRGTAAARLFRRGHAPEEHPPGSRLDALLA